MYIPDHSILKRVQQIDPLLNIRWMPNKERWVVTRSISRLGHLYQQEVIVFIVQGRDGSFRELDQRLIDQLHRNDTNAHSLRERTLDIMKRNEEQGKRTARAQRQKFEDITKERIKEWQGLREAAGMGAANVPKEDLALEIKEFDEAL